MFTRLEICDGNVVSEEYYDLGGTGLLRFRRGKESCLTIHRCSFSGLESLIKTCDTLRNQIKDVLKTDAKAKPIEAGRLRSVTHFCDAIGNPDMMSAVLAKEPDLALLEFPDSMECDVSLHLDQVEVSPSVSSCWDKSWSRWVGGCIAFTSQDSAVVISKLTQEQLDVLQNECRRLILRLRYPSSQTFDHPLPTEDAAMAEKEFLEELRKMEVNGSHVG